MKLSIIQIPRKTSSLSYSSNERLYIRKFILSSFRVYTSLLADISIDNNTSHLDNRDDNLNNPIILALSSSLSYREHLKILLSDIDLIAGSLNEQQQNNDENKEIKAISDEINECITLYDNVKNIEHIWHLIEVLYLNQSNLLSLELFKWFKVNSYVQTLRTYN